MCSECIAQHFLPLKVNYCVMYVVLNDLREEQQQLLHLCFLNDDMHIFVQIWLWTEISSGTIPFLSICHNQI